MNKTKYIQYVRYIKKFINWFQPIIDEHLSECNDYYKIELMEGDYNKNDKLAIFKSNFNITERKLLDVYIRIRNSIMGHWGVKNAVYMDDYINVFDNKEINMKMSDRFYDFYMVDGNYRDTSGYNTKNYYELQEICYKLNKICDGN